VNVQPKKPTMQGPGEWFTGDVWIDSIVQPLGDSQLNVGAVHFAPSARTAWHSHAGGQTLYVTEAVVSSNHAAKPSSSSVPATCTSRPTATSTGTGRPTTTS
jgi:hypothetical protein